MRLLFLNHNVAWSGGTFYRAFQFARSLVKRGHDVDLITISPRLRFGFDRYRRDGVQVIEGPDLFWGVGRSGWDPWSVLNRLVAVSAGDWDVIHAWDCRPAVILPARWARARSSMRSMLVIDWCDWWSRGGTQSERPAGWTSALYDPVEEFFEEAFRSDCDGATVISRALQARVQGLGVPASRVMLLPQGCEPEVVSPTSREAAREKVGIGPCDRVLLTVGAMTSGEAELLFASIREIQRLRVDTRVFMIGKHRARVPTDLRRAGRLVETGFVHDDELSLYKAASDLLLVPLPDTIASRSRWPSKINPFLAAGRVVATTAVGDLALLLRRENAAIVSEPDAHSFALAVDAALDDAAGLAAIAQNARSAAASLLPWDGLAADLERFYGSLSEKRAGVARRTEGSAAASG